MASSSERSLLPFELMEEILWRVPAESLTRFKLSCKRWLALFKDKKFINNHLDLVQQHFIRINHIVQIINPVTQTQSSLPIPDKLQDKTNISSMVQCDGLLLCKLQFCKLAIWNPFFHLVRWIDPYNPYSVNDFYGIGYDNASRDYNKILRFYNGEFEDERGNRESHNPQVEIYEFKSSSWRTLDANSLDWCVVYPCKGVSVKGNMYWIAERNHSFDNFIQCFDFSIETFKPICSIPINYGAFDVVALSSYKGDKLSLLYQHEDKVEMEVWITNKVNGNVIVSWTKLFILTRPGLPKLLTHEELAHPVYFIDNNSRIVICCDELVEDGHQVSVSIYIIGNDGFKKQVEIERHRIASDGPSLSGYAFLPSLVPILE